jgi:predicted transcriptional regulator
MAMGRSADAGAEQQPTTLILRSMSDDKSMELFKIIASVTSNDVDHSVSNNEMINTHILITRVKLTRKQYYSRISSLISSGLVKRSNGKYIITSLGKVVYRVIALVDQAIHDSWKLRAIDAIESKSSSGILDEEYGKLVDMLIDNHELKEILSAKRTLSKEIKKKVNSAGKQPISIASRI